MKKERVVPKKNYIYLFIMIIVVVVLTFMIFGLNNRIKSKKLEISYLDGYVTKINLNEISNVLSEPSSELFILVTETNNEGVYKFESDLKRIIKKYDLRDNFIFVDLTKNKDKLNILNKTLNSDIKSVPAIIYLKNGEFIKSIDSSDNILNASEFEKLLDEYEVK